MTPDLNRVFSKLESLVFSDKTLKLFFLMVFSTRLIYVIFVIDPNSGQDAPSFDADAKKIISDGIFTPLVHAPQWPIGYSWFVAFWWAIFGIESKMLGVVQTSLLLLAQIYAVKLVRDFVDTKSSQLFGYLILMNFALFSSSGQLMYEVPFASLLLLGAYNLRGLVRNLGWDYHKAALSGISFGLAILIHPSALAPSLALILVALWKNQFSIRLILQSLLLLSLLSSGVFAQVARNSLAGDGRGFTVTAFGNATNSGWGSNNSVELQRCGEIGDPLLSPKKLGLRWDSPERQLCMYRIALDDPSLMGEIFVLNSKRFWSPYVGILKGGGTWYHGLDWRRVVSPYGYKWWEGTTRLVDQTIGYGWMIIHFTLFVTGAITMSRRRSIESLYRLKVILFFLIPIISTYFVSLMTHGDSRHRMPILIFYEVFVAIGILSLFNALKKLKTKVSVI